MDISAFKKEIRAYYRKHGRKLPWRETADPYAVWISEMMLQQTQVDRVIPKYEAFLKRFPTVEKLARAPLASVLSLWQGLGYNRRALLLHRAAKEIVRQARADAASDAIASDAASRERVPFPEDPERLEKLPGIGHYTARAIAAFAYNKPHAFIETNIRAVYIHFFFPDQGTVTDAELLPLIEETLDRKNPRAWYSALMDYGAKLKKEGKGKNARSAHYAKQKAFKGSDREVRGAILRMAVERKRLTLAQLVRGLPFPKERIASNVEKLAKEGLLRSERGIIRIR